MGKDVDTGAFSDFIRSLYDRFRLMLVIKSENCGLCIADFMKHLFPLGVASPEVRSGRKKGKKRRPA